MSDHSEDEGEKAGIAAVLPLITVSALVVLFVVWLVAH